MRTTWTGALRPEALLIGLLACGGGKSDSETDLGEPCGIQAPEVRSARVADCGMHDFDGESLAGVLVEADVADADGGLSGYGLQVFWDEELDGEVEASGTYFEVLGEFEGATRCEVTQATLALWFSVTEFDDTPPPGETVELGVVALDEAYDDSGTPVVVEAVMPTVDGNCP